MSDVNPPRARRACASAVVVVVVGGGGGGGGALNGLISNISRVSIDGPAEVYLPLGWVLVVPQTCELSRASANS